ncbi:upf0553 protein c9orf64 [Plakobranchus ocellatus]|uniref:Queuosine 5'-phosphate N-glycosylase/hydrolase n=1 Tax=Plakobranchus ocellatus TaxID=259542 RepID=A0AAV4AVY3_9GAST|nr:upf0553 protein c9orf64 [Plakobranchus ocellatus]
MQPSALMEGVLNPREAGRFITENSKDVFIEDGGIQKVAGMLYKKIKTGDFNVKMWRKHELNPQSMDEDAVNWVFVSAVLNFSFWSEKASDKFTVKYKEKDHTGYWALCAAMNRALDEGFKITTPSFYSTVSMEQMKKIFRSDSDIEIPLLEERQRVLTEAGLVLMKKYQGSFANVIKQADKSAQSLLRLVLQDFPSFQDVAEYNGKKVGLYKRAQILVGDIWGCCEGQGLGQFNDIDTITMFADYRIPQALVYFGALRYSDSLMEKLKQSYLFKSEEKLEVEIRGVSLWACELIRDSISAKLAAETDEGDKPEDGAVNAILIDHYLWDTRRDMADEMEHIPFHRCRGIYY